MTLRLGFFSEFKGAQSVLLTGQPEDIKILCAAIERFVLSEEEELPLHKIADVAKRQPAKLFVCRSLPTSNRNRANEFHWLCPAPELSAVKEKLLALTGARGGHQYVELVESGYELIVSVGEYNESWWDANG